MFHLVIITPDSTVFDGDIDQVTLPTSAGEITVLPHHVPLITTVIPGPAIVKSGNTETIFAISRGVIEVNGSGVRVLSDIADRAEDLEEIAVEKAKAQAEKLLAEKREDAEEFAQAMAIMDKELARIRTVRRHRSGRGFAPSPVHHE